MKTFYFSEASQKIILLIIATVLTLVIAECVLEISKADQFFIRRPNRQVLVKPDPRYIRGVYGDSRFTVNHLGLRGDELRDQEIRILTIGGSTTESSYVDDTEAWPYLLQEGLKKQTGRSIWIGNAGVGGHNTRHHILQLEKLLDQIPDVDLVITLIGANEPAMFLRSDYIPDGLDDPALRERYLFLSFNVAPRKLRSYRDLQLYRLLRSFAGRLSPKLDYFLFYKNEVSYEQYQNGFWHENRRQRRRSSRKVLLSKEQNELLLFGFHEYRKNIKMLNELGQKHDAKVLFLTQPALFMSELSESEENLLRGGGFQALGITEPQDYVFASEMKRMFGLVNRALLETGEKNGLNVMDLEPVISAQSDSFYDDVHFTEIGSARVAQAVADYVCKNDLLPVPCAHVSAAQS